MQNTESLVHRASNELLLVTMSRTGLTMTKSDKGARQRLAEGDHVAEGQYRVSKVLLPKGYDAEYKALTGAMNASYGAFIKTTMAFGKSADGKSADRDRVVTTTQIINENWVGHMANFQRDIAAKKEEFALALPGIMQRISADPAYAATFDPSVYPTPEQIRDSFKFTIDGPKPIGRFDYIPITGSMGEALAKRFEVQTAERIKFGQQQVAKDLLAFVKNAANNLGNLAEYLSSEDQTGRQPRIFDTLVSNIHDTVAKVRTFAMEETAEGAALLALADRIEAEIAPPERNAGQFKDNVTLSRATAEKAAVIAEDIESLDVLWD